MDRDEEIVRIVLEAHEPGDRWRWHALYGQTQRGASRFEVFDLKVGDELVIGVRWRRARWEPTRVVDPLGHRMPAPVKFIESDDVDDMWIPGLERDRSPIAPGDLITAVIAFSADDGTGRTSKIRPALVMEVNPGEIRFRGVYGVGGSLHSTGGGRRIRDWREAGLRKASVVSARDEWMLIDAPLKPSLRFGRLTSHDRNSLLGGAPE